MSREEELLRRLRAAFEIEAHESLDAMAAALLALERAAPAGTLPPDIVERIYREAHNLKGAARAVNFAAVEALCQPMESVFAVWKKGAAPPSPAGFDVLHSALDAVRSIVENGGNEGTTKTSALAAQIIALTDSANTPSAPPTPPILPQTLPQSPTIARPPVASPPTPREVPAPPAPQPTPLPSEPPALVSSAPIQPPAPIAAPAPVAHRAKAPENAETVRIAATKLDSLLLQAEELLAAKLTAHERTAKLHELHEHAETGAAEWQKHLPVLLALADARGDKLGDALLDFLARHSEHLKKQHAATAELASGASSDARSLGGMIDNLLEDTKKLLMLPCATLLENFPRTVRDVARERGKAVDFIDAGGEVEVDKRILEAMKAPLIHLLRNAVDHGIETPDVRERTGKPPRATIRLTVTQHGGEVEFTVADDGAGIAVAKVKDRAVQNGLLTAEEAFRLPDDEAAQLIFASDLSTSDRVDELSGRGLGMAIVRDSVERLGGRVRTETVPGQGTTFHLRLPLTLATFRGLLVKAGGQTFVLPITDVARVARVPRGETKSIGNRATIRLNERTLRFLTLASALELADTPSDSRWQSVVVLGQGERTAAFAVDEVLGDQEVLVKRLGPPLVRVRGIAGATILGSGHPAAILNVADLLQSTAKAAPRSFAPTPTVAPRTVSAAKKILVADDSITSRMLLKDILEASGFAVKTAVDGAEALTALRSEHFDLLVSDVDMPRMDGFSLVTRIRADAKLAQLPTVLVTGRDSREDRERGFDAGASAYVVKSNFDQSNLLEIVRRLI